MVDIIDEIKEDLHHERLAKLWKNYGAWVIGAAILIILGTAGNVWWRGHVASQQENLSGQYYHAIELLQQGKNEEAVNALKSLRQSDSKAYPALAGFAEASHLLLQSKHREAATIYQSIADNNNVDKALRELASLQVVNLQLAYKLADNQTIEKSLKTLAKPDSTWRFSALELQAANALEQGDKAKALELFNTINEAPLAPGSIKDRAAEMVQALGNESEENK